MVITYGRHTFRRRVSRGQLAVGWPSDDDTHTDAMTLHLTQSSSIFECVKVALPLIHFTERYRISVYIFSMNVRATCPCARVRCNIIAQGLHSFVASHRQQFVVHLANRWTRFTFSESKNNNNIMRKEGNEIIY